MKHDNLITCFEFMKTVDDTKKSSLECDIVGGMEECLDTLDRYSGACKGFRYTRRFIVYTYLRLENKFSTLHFECCLKFKRFVNMKSEFILQTNEILVLKSEYISRYAKVKL